LPWLNSPAGSETNCRTDALPGHKYPVEDAAHARNAKARAAQQVKAGNLSKADKKKVDAKADKVLNKKS
jgi:hypothetical protein